MGAADPVKSRLLARIADALGHHLPRRLGVAVSGGGDSVALLRLLHEFSTDRGISLFAASVDHGLRPEAAAEAAFVAGLCTAHSIPHTVLTWDGYDGQGNLQAAARAARYRLLSDWAQGHDLDAVALGHTQDDQAETVLLRLARKSGVDGLAAMAAERIVHDTRFLRPLLTVSRQELRDYLSAENIRWVDDPSNDDTQFDRVKARAMLKTLAPLGIDAPALSEVADHMRAARQVLQGATAAAADKFMTISHGDLLIDQAGLAGLSPEISRRLFRGALMWVSASDYPPRREKVTAFQTALIGGEAATLHGCYGSVKEGQIRLTRELAAIAEKTARPDQIWDQRWRLTGPEIDHAEIRPLGPNGLQDCPEWRNSGLPRASLLSSPAIWQGDTLLSAPLAGLKNGWEANLTENFANLGRYYMSH